MKTNFILIALLFSIFGYSQTIVTEKLITNSGSQGPKKL